MTVVIRFLVEGAPKDEPTERMPRWLADWLLGNEFITGFFRGRRVLRARIEPWAQA